VGHNHPSGDPTPSTADRHLTERLHAAGKLLGIELLDSLVLGEPPRYFSFAEEGMLS
jgi:DNA repair protein RadC